MLINLSHHSSDGWSERQRHLAIDRFGAIEDWPFPNIPPAWSLAEVTALVRDYAGRIERARPAAVHLMGEMTFVFRLALALRTRDIPCVASTTERQVDMVEGKKVVTFEFVAFRPYY